MITNLNALWARVVIGELSRAGVRHLCACTGSRSAPLIIAAHERDDLEVTVHLDERSASYFAVGIARATRGPTAVLCTSGTAAANFLPAVAEAARSGLPLVVLTADRPPELRGTEALQTIDQIRLYGRNVLAFRDLPAPEPSLPSLRAAGAAVASAVSAAVGPRPGPAHLNVPFREPLAPVPEDPERMLALAGEYEALLREETLVAEIDRPGPRGPTDEEMDRLACLLREARRPLIVTGPDAAADRSAADRIVALADATGAPLLADVASGLRFAAGAGESVCAHAELFLRCDAFTAGPGPDLVLRIGRFPVSKAVQEQLARHRPVTVAIRRDAMRRDPDNLVSHHIDGNPGEICGLLLGRIGQHAQNPSHATWRDRFLIADRATCAHLAAGPLPLEAAATRAAVAAMPTGSALFLSNSMPIRWAEAYCAASMSGTTVHVSRGASGIDGVTSTALGVCLGLDRPLLLVTGDVAFLHDAGGLLAARHLRRPVVILVLNNDGGGIFSFLPIGKFPEICGPLFRAPHGAHLEAASAIFGLEHRLAATAEEAARLVSDGLSKAGASVIEVRTDADVMAREHGQLLARLSGVVADALRGNAI